MSILGPLTDVVGAFAALKKAEQSRWVATGDPAVDAARVADERGRGAWMADTALELLSGRAEGQPQPVEVALVMREGAVVPTDSDTEPVPGDEVEVPGWGAMPGVMAREHLLRLCDTGTATWLRRLWTAPGGRDLVAMDSTRRLFSGVLRQLVELRDATCRVPFCGAPIRDIDHVTGHARGGETSAINAMGECQLHNLVKEAPGWRAEVVSTGLDPGGGPHEVTLTTPTGKDYSCVAPPVLGHGRPQPSEPEHSRCADGADLRHQGRGFDIQYSPLEVHLAGLTDAA
ncbi:HNH endonuclease [Janibacter limosus]|uniref:HNH endonuclease n=1 Tax=Janibacter limosus TaxID=53458 RepID=UPI003F6F845C